MPAVIDITATINTQTKQVTISGEGNSAAQFMDMLANQTQQLYGLGFAAVTSPAEGEGSIAKSARITLDSSLVSQLTVPLKFNDTPAWATAAYAPGSYTPCDQTTTVADLTACLGINFSIPYGMMSIDLVYTANPPELAVRLKLSMSSLNLKGFDAWLEVKEEQNASLVVRAARGRMGGRARTNA